MKQTAIALFFIYGLVAEAKIFSNSYVSFELPPNWDCLREGTEWVCTSQFEKSQAKEAIIILTAKEIGPADSIQLYTEHLKKPRLIPSKGGPTQQSKVLHVQQRTIQNHLWVDGLHQGSEVPTYYTRYMATLKDKIAILVSFSAHRNVYTKYSSDFIKAIDSLRITATKDLLQRAQSQTNTQRNETFGQPIPPSLASEGLPDSSTNSSSSPYKKWAGLGLILIGIAIFIFTRVTKRRRPKQKR